MKELNIKIVNKSSNPLPVYKTVDAAGMDLQAAATITLKPGERKLMPTGLYMQLPEGYEAQIRSRSGMALRDGIIVLNEPGTIDADYRGEIGIILANLGDREMTIRYGERVAQMVVKKYEKVVWEVVDSLNTTDRADGGFGHTGK